MNIFLVNKDNEFASSLIEKLHKVKQNEILPLSTGEMDLYISEDFQHLYTDNKGDQKIVKLEKGGTYVFMVDISRDNINDVMKTISVLKLNATIIRQHSV